MIITYEVKHYGDLDALPGGGCYTQCYEHSDCGSDYHC